LGWLEQFVLWTAAVGLAMAAGLILAGSLVARRSLLHWLPLLWATTTFLAMTHLPLPDPGSGCPKPFTEPQLTPFNLLWERAGSVSRIYSLSTVANFLLCAVIGALLRPFTARAWVALGCAAVLSLAVELSQLTGMFGLFPCPWRQFDVDDLILNILGVLAGFLAVGRVRAWRGRG
jgi:hypothetical protein